MLHKKLIAIGCAVAIVGMGACFLPPEHVQPPPLPPYLSDVRIFSIEVHDESGQDVMDDDAMSREVASKFNQLWKDYGLIARPVRGSKATDAVLRIRIERKSASVLQETIGRPRWEFHLRASFALTAADGRLLWQKPEENTKFIIPLENGFPPDGWQSRVIRHIAGYSLAMRSGDLLYGLHFGAR